MINNGFLNGLVQSLFQKGKSSTSQIENQAKPDTKGRSLPTVKFDPKLVHNPEMAANIRNNVQTIKCIGWCIGSENTKEVEAAVTRAAASGRNIKMLTDELEHTYGITRKCASFIACDQIEKATSQIAQREELALGLVYGRWVHGRGGKHPRPCHVKANGKIFKIAKGMFIQGRWVLPGMDINCRCIWEILLPGYQDFKVGTVPKGYKEVYPELQKCPERSPEFLYGILD